MGEIDTVACDIHPDYDTYEKRSIRPRRRGKRSSEDTFKVSRISAKKYTEEVPQVIKRKHGGRSEACVVYPCIPLVLRYVQDNKTRGFT